jgi:L-lactate dehydrogenase complex protein LldG
MNERNKILDRIREALAIPGPKPGHAQTESHAPVGTPPIQNAQQWLPPVGESFEQRLKLFQENAAVLKAAVHLANDRKELVRLLLELRDTESWKKIGTHGGELTDLAGNALALPVCRTDKSYDVKNLESCDAGITECDALVAQTGSVLVTSRSAGGRALSVLPPHHVVLASEDQLLADLPAAFALLKTKYGANYPSFISFITGPSRTGDIERILVLGAHGPKRLTIIVLSEARSPGFSR